MSMDRLARLFGYRTDRRPEPEPNHPPEPEPSPWPSDEQSDAEAQAMLNYMMRTGQATFTLTTGWCASRDDHTPHVDDSNPDHPYLCIGKMPLPSERTAP